VSMLLCSFVSLVVVSVALVFYRVGWFFQGLSELFLVEGNFLYLSFLSFVFAHWSFVLF
jgi:hypothetical protein